MEHLRKKLLWSWQVTKPAHLSRCCFLFHSEDKPWPGFPTHSGVSCSPQWSGRTINDMGSFCAPYYHLFAPFLLSFMQPQLVCAALPFAWGRLGLLRAAQWGWAWHGHCWCIWVGQRLWGAAHVGAVARKGVGKAVSSAGIKKKKKLINLKLD